MPIDNLILNVESDFIIQRQDVTSDALGRLARISIFEDTAPLFAPDAPELV